MTRDSKILRVLQISALVLAAMVAMMTNPADYGLSPIAVKWLALISTVVGTVAGFLGTSPLKGENDAEKVSGSSSRLPLVLLAVALGAASLSSLGGCALRGAPATPNASAASVATLEQTIKRDAIKIADEVQSVTAKIREVRNAAELANRAKLLSNKRMDQIDEACLAYVAMTRRALRATQLAATAAALTNTAEMVWATVSDLLKQLTNTGVAELTGLADVIRGLMPTTIATAGSKS